MEKSNHRYPLDAASGTAEGGTEAMSNDITYMDCWHFIAPLIPVNTDYAKDIYIMVFNALEEAEKRRIAGKKKKEDLHET